MPRTKLLVSALALALAGTTTAQAQSFSGVITFGDSLSDAGNVAAIDGNPYTPLGSSFTTNTDPVYAEIVANAFGANGSASRTGGSNYAYGGACIRANGPTFTCVNDPSGPAGLFSITNQISGYLAGNGGHADSNALYNLWGGANDIFTYARQSALSQITGTQAQQLTGLSAQTTVGLAAALQAAGARTIVMYNLPDLGLTPLNVGTASQPGASALAFVYNSTFNAGLATLGDGIVSINTYGLINEIVANPSLYGFTDVTHRACGNPSSSLACGVAGDASYFYHYAAGTNQTYLFADDVHPSGAAHAMLANVVIATLSAPGQVSMAGELPLQVYDNQSSVINGQIFGMNNTARSEGESNVYGKVQFGNQKFDAAANTNGLDSSLFTATLGADVRYNDAISLGAAVTFGGSQGDGPGASIDSKEVMVSAYGVAHFGSGYVNAIASGGSSHLDIDRSIVLGPTTRVETGNTTATHTAFELGAGFAFGSDDFRHGPFVSLTWQKVDVSGYAEDSTDSSAMYFNDFGRKSTVGRIGYQAEMTSGAFQPFGRIAWAKDSQHTVTAVQAGSQTLNGHFTLDGFEPAQDWMEADLGVNYKMSDATSLSLSYRARLSDDTQDTNSANLGVRVEF